MFPLRFEISVCSGYFKDSFVIVVIESKINETEKIKDLNSTSNREANYTPSYPSEEKRNSHPQLSYMNIRDPQMTQNINNRTRTPTSINYNIKNDTK